MKLSLIALDYDGTIAAGEVVDRDVRGAIADARAAGVVVALVTGRRLADLHRVAGDLHFVDAVVAENGAVLHFPSSGYRALLAPPPSGPLLEELLARGVSHTAGACVIEADAASAPMILDAIRTRELPLAVLFNRGRVMVLPQSISKATGLREAMTILRLSLHSAVAIGDAENDHEMLRACEVGAAVAWGSAALQGAADTVIAGHGPAAVATYIRALLRRGQLPAVARHRRELQLGHTDDGQPFTLAVRGRNVLIAGDARSGKSWVAGLLAEQLILQRYSVCVIDPEGDYRPLETLPGVTVLGGADPLPRPRDLLRALGAAESSVVIDLSHVTHEQKVSYTASLLPAMARLRTRTGMPHRVILDEAHYFLSAANPCEDARIEAGGFTLATYRASHLPHDVLRSSEVVIVTCESDPAEIAALHDACGSVEPVEHWAAVLPHLSVGEAAALPVTDEAGRRLRRIHLGPRLTHHIRHREKYVDIPVPEPHAFVFTRDGAPTGRRGRTLRELVDALERESVHVLEGHLRRSDFSRWLGDVFGDRLLAATVRRIEERAVKERYPDAPAAIADVVRGRYELSDAGPLGEPTAPVPGPRAEGAPGPGRNSTAGD